MARLTKEQLNKWNEGAGQGFTVDAQHYIFWGDKVLEAKGPARADKSFFVVRLRYDAEKTGNYQFTGKQILEAHLDRYVPEGEIDGLYHVDFIHSETVGEPQNKKMFSYMQKMSHEIDLAALFAIGEEARPIDAEMPGNNIIPVMDMIDETPETVTEVTETPAETEEAATEDNITVKEEEAPTEAQNDATSETATETPEETPTETPETGSDTEEPAPSMFETLARAYITGKAVKTPHRAETPAPVVETVTEPEAPTEATEDTTTEPENIAPGYHNNDNDSLTPEELTTLTQGGQIERGEGWRRELLFTANHSEKVKYIYGAHIGDYPHIQACLKADYHGFIAEGNYYNNVEPIKEKMCADIKKRLAELIPDEASAARSAANVESWEKERIEELKEYDFTSEAQRLFYDNTRPELCIYHSTKFDYENIIQYILDPLSIIETLSLDYLCRASAEIYRAYIKYNRTLAKYNAIVADKGNTEHMLKRISSAITDQKTVRILLATGKEVRADAGTLKRLPYMGYISAYNVTAADRQYLIRNEYNRPEDIKPDEIKAIYHGGRTLYKAS